jgi:hypothetical protein
LPIPRHRAVGKAGCRCDPLPDLLNQLEELGPSGHESGRRRRIRVWPLLGGILAAIVLLLVGIWLGGHPSVLPAPLRASVFESRRSDIATEQAPNILTSRYFRPLKRATLVDLALSGMVAGLDDPYSHYLDPNAYQSRSEPETPRIGIGINTKPEPNGLRITGVVERSPAARAGPVLHSERPQPGRRRTPGDRDRAQHRGTGGVACPGR